MGQRETTVGSGPLVSGESGAPNDPPSRFWLGAAAALVTVTIWSGWIVATRFAVTTVLTTGDVALLRFGIASIILSPVLLRNGLAVKRIGVFNSAVMTAGAGIVFYLVATNGMRLVPAAGVGTLLPGTMPMFVALLSLIVLKEQIARLRWLGFGLILAGVIWVTGFGLPHSVDILGVLLLPASGLLWACYTIAMRRSGIDPWHASGLVNVYSLVLLLPVYFLFMDSRFAEASWSEIALHGFVQGVLSGALALSTYGVAVRLIGPSRAAAFAALIPVMVALFGIPILGEVPGMVTMIGVVVVSCGVALASGAIGVAYDAARK